MTTMKRLLSGLLLAAAVTTSAAMAKPAPWFTTGGKNPGACEETDNPGELVANLGGLDQIKITNIKDPTTGQIVQMSITDTDSGVAANYYRTMDGCKAAINAAIDARKAKIRAYE